MKNLLCLARSCTLLAAFVTGAACAKQPCLGYEPQVVVLSGKLVRKTYPGPPNFVSVAQGDRAETGYYLQLDAPICTHAREDEEAGDHGGVKLLQLVLSSTQYAKLKPALGSGVTLKGTLFEAFTGHHHTQVLMTVTGKP